ncbi:malto-oligosyltrehalose trehalohydrolase [Dyadobacter psychrophilus]|nr:malto-oligosyltrehalose trehalohydrolase [Dyadobacter psychrophilus]
MQKIGVQCLGNRVKFTVWAPEKERMQLQLTSPRKQAFEMIKQEDGYFEFVLDEAGAGFQYFFSPNGNNRFPDPASQYQPEGVHGASEVVDHSAFRWEDQDWKGLPFEDLIIYELHVGTFTPEGTFEAIIPRLEKLAATGINAIELMPVNEFPGNRNWGYDGVYPYAVHSAYGGPDKLKSLVNAAHKAGIAVILDMVYNHLGPEGNYFGEFGPYFTDSYKTPWGRAINLDGEYSDGVREYFSENPVFWYEKYHLDGLRLDAIHTIYDNSAKHFWEVVYQKLNRARQQNGRSFHMIAESDLNSPHVVKSPEVGGLGFTAQWLDDFHHASYVLLDNQGRKRYEDFGQTSQLLKAYTDGFVHSGEYVKFRKRRHGASSVGISGTKFVVFNQNHDQIGNRVGGERLSMLVDFERQKLAAAVIMLSPYVPMLFMGEEYGEDAPFFYFVSHSDEELIQLVVEGRKKEFESFDWDSEPLNPQQEDTFNRSKIVWEKQAGGKYKIMHDWHKALITLRKTNPALRNFDKNDIRATLVNEGAFTLHRRSADQKEELLCLFSLTEQPTTFELPAHQRAWTCILNSRDERWDEHSQSVEQHQKTLERHNNITCHGPGVYILYAGRQSAD